MGIHDCGPLSKANFSSQPGLALGLIQQGGLLSHLLHQRNGGLKSARGVVSLMLKHHDRCTRGYNNIGNCATSSYRWIGNVKFLVYFRVNFCTAVETSWKHPFAWWICERLVVKVETSSSSSSSSAPSCPNSIVPPIRVIRGPNSPTNLLAARQEQTDQMWRLRRWKMKNKSFFKEYDRNKVVLNLKARLVNIPMCHYQVASHCCLSNSLSWLPFHCLLGTGWVLSYCWLHTSPFFVHFPTGTEKNPICCGNSHPALVKAWRKTPILWSASASMEQWKIPYGALKGPIPWCCSLLDLPLNWMMIMNHHLVGGAITILKNMNVNGTDDIPYMKWKIIQMFQTFPNHQPVIL